MSEDTGESDVFELNTNGFAWTTTAPIVVIGITDHAQQALGELVYVEVPESRSGPFAKGDACIVVESVKAASDVYAPVSGERAQDGERRRSTDEPDLVNAESV